MGVWGLAARELVEHGSAGIKLLRRTGKLVAPGITRKAESRIRKHYRFASKVSAFLPQALDAATEAAAATAMLSTGNVALGLPVAVAAGHSVDRAINSAQELFSQAKKRATVPKVKVLDKEQTRRDKDQARNVAGAAALLDFDSTTSDPTISPDLLATMTKGIREQMPAI